MKNAKIAAVIILFLFIFPVSIYGQEEVRLVSYYPSPRGFYTEAKFGSINATAGTDHHLTLAYEDGLDMVGPGYNCHTIYGSGNDPIQISHTNDGTTADIFIDLAGNVGISTSTPLGLFHVSSTTIPAALVVSNIGNVGVGIANPTGPLHVSVGTNGDALVVATNGDVGIGTSNPVGIFHVCRGGPAEDLVVTSAGRVGIGTSDPISALQVIGALTRDSGTGATQLLGSNTTTHVNLGFDSQTGLTGSGNQYITIGGGYQNSASAVGSTISGGEVNLAQGTCSFIGGGINNIASGIYSTIAGGNNNSARSSYATVAGGYNNQADGIQSFVGGGSGNIASSSYSSVLSGVENTCGGQYSSVLSGRDNSITANYSLVAGYHAVASHYGSFVWADNSSGTDFESDSNYQFKIRATGGLDYVGNATSAKLSISPNDGDGGSYSSVILAEGYGGALWPYGMGIEYSGSDDKLFFRRVSQGSLTGNLITIERSTGDVAINTPDPDGYKLNVNGDIKVNGDIDYTGSLDHISDVNLKNVLGYYRYGMVEICKINPVRFMYKETNELDLPLDREFIGGIAQEIEKVIPDAVKEGKDGYLRVNKEPIFWAMLNAIKELKQENDLLKERVGKLEKKK